MNTRLIEGYLNAVKTSLPGPQRDDIARELSEDILLRLEAREAELGRPLTDAEQEAVLKRLGHPALVAGRYSTDTRSVAFGRLLIGPVLFPLYIKVLAISLSLTLAGGFVLLLLLGDVQPPTLPGVLQTGLVNFAIVTVIFALAQRQIDRHPDHWNPRDPLGAIASAKDPHAVSRFEVIVELVVGAIAVLWLRSLSNIVLFPLGDLTLAPVWSEVYWPVLGFAVLSLVPPAILLFRPRWMVLRRAANFVENAVWLGFVLYIALAGEWVRVAPAVLYLPSRLDTLNLTISFGLWAAVVVLAAFALYHLYRLIQLLARPTANGPSRASA